MSLNYLLRFQRVTFVSLLAISLAGFTHEHADARAAHHQNAKHEGKHEGRHHVVHGPDYRPPYAAIVVDANSGQVLHEANADEPRHPASVTKIMTLYLLFEQVEAGKFKLDTPLKISAQAAIQPPTKLGLKPNQTITVDDAIKGLCTRSANDAAVVVSEAVGGSEGEFGRLMTLKARELGMANTTYVNASGLPAEEQVTTARDQAILGRAIQERFPEFYRYFSTVSFRYHGADIHNHNALLGQVPGVDGIKTGYTEASGYNLVASVRREPRHIVAVVLGGNSGGMRDARMRQLIEEYIPRASAQRTAPVMPAAARDATPPGGAVEKSEPAAVPAPGAVVTPSETIAPAAPAPIPVAVPAETVAPAVPAAAPSETVAPAILAPTPIVVPSETVAPTPANVKPEQSESARPQSSAAKSRAQARRGLAPATTGRGAASISTVARPPLRGSWW
jgi:D-alanyl-D-alanine carboxypeptidase